MSIFLFAYGDIQLIECGLSANIGLWWYIDIYENSLGKWCGLQLIMRYSTSGEQNLETSLDIMHQLFFYMYA
jgi:hypothetical protein